MNEKLLEYQRALLLFHLLAAPNRTLAKSDANKKLTSATKKSLDLTTSAANEIRDQMTAEGFLERLVGKRSVRFRLADKGLAMLAAQEQYPTLDIRLKGREFNALLAAVRELARDWQRPGQELATPSIPEDLASKILGVVQELQRERAGYSQLVPIYEIRLQVAKKWGAAAASHDVFDEEVKLLWREKKLRMVPISDMRDGTAEQLMHSIPGRIVKLLIRGRKQATNEHSAPGRQQSSTNTLAQRDFPLPSSTRNGIRRCGPHATRLTPLADGNTSRVLPNARGRQ
jgi:hypothetical protein